MGNLGPLDGELVRALLTNLEGGGFAMFPADTAELDDVDPFDPQNLQEQGLEFDEKQRGKNNATLSIAEARSASSNLISWSDFAMES